MRAHTLKPYFQSAFYLKQETHVTGHPKIADCSGELTRISLCLVLACDR